MCRNVLIAAALIVGGCAPKVITVPAPRLAAVEADGQAIRLAWPVDARPPAERHEGTYYVGNAPNPQVSYGELNLRPGVLVAVDRAIRAGMSARGIPEQPEAELIARVFVLHHAGWRDISDAQWVSTATGNLVGNVPKLFYPAFAMVTTRIRLEVVDGQGERVLLRDFEAFETWEKPLFFSWPWPYLFLRSPVPDAFEQGFAAAHTQLATDIGTALDQVRTGEPVTAGVEPAEPAQHTADNFWWRGPRGSTDNDHIDWVDPVSTTLHGSPRFSAISGHSLEKGEVVGRMGFPVDTFAWDAGISKRWSVQGTSTALFQPFQGLRFYGNIGGGLRFKPWMGKNTQLALQPYFAFDLPIVTGEGLRPDLASARAGALAQVSWRHEWATLFLQAGPALTRVLRTYPDIPALADLEEGRVVTLNGTVGLEAQVSPSVSLGAELRVISATQSGEQVDIGPLTGPTLAPQISVGLR